MKIEKFYQKPILRLIKLRYNTFVYCVNEKQQKKLFLPFHCLFNEIYRVSYTI